MNNRNVASSWKSAFRSGFEKKYIELIIDSYKKISGKKFQQIPWENTRRNMLCEQMRKNKAKYGITFNISTEAGVYDENYKDNGRIAFLEEGDFEKLYSKLTTELPQYTLDNAVLDISSQHSYQYILKTKHGRNGNDSIVLFHILMDFS